MEPFPVFLSVVVVVRNAARHLEERLSALAAAVSPLVGDHEIIVVDNGSDDASLVELKRLTSETGIPNLQVYALTKEVDEDTAAWVGLENALGDFVLVFDPLEDDLGFLPTMVGKAVGGADVVMARNERRPRSSWPYRAGLAAFNVLFRLFHGIHLAKEAPRYRVVSKRVVSFLLRHPRPALSYRHLPATAGFARVNLSYQSEREVAHVRSLRDGLDRGIRLLVSTTRAPMRLVTTLSLFGAGANLLYSAYVVAVGLFKKDVAPGWLSLSLQQSGMFFLISLVLLVLGEYILQMASLSNEGPPYHVAQELTSVLITRRGKLNVEEGRQRPTRPVRAEQVV
jgi:glycosyltransferase involved in cell wall biosynthesis